MLSLLSAEQGTNVLEEWCSQMQASMSVAARENGTHLHRPHQEYIVEKGKTCGIGAHTCSSLQASLETGSMLCVSVVTDTLA